MDSTILLYIIKLITGGLVAFLAIFIMSKTRDAAWMSIVCGFVLSYASLMYDLMVTLGIFPSSPVQIYGIPLPALISVILPNICFITGFIIKLIKK